MARKKLREFQAKTLLSQALHEAYSGISYNLLTDTPSLLSGLDDEVTYVVKVDEGVKKRFKKGLVALDVKKTDLSKEMERMGQKGFNNFLIEPFVSYAASEEKYLAFEQVREGVRLYYSSQGGVDIEENQASVKQVMSSPPALLSVAQELDIAEGILQKVLSSFKTNNFSFLEINPFIISQEKIYPLDAAVEVDSAAEFFVKGAWTSSDFVSGEVTNKSHEERAIDELSKQSQASFSFTPLNPDGRLFMVLSGGGASIVVADEAYNQGKGSEVANYGEYSGNPTAEETYLYTQQILRMLGKSHASKKVLIIAGGVANFTDVRITFRGVIKALEEVKDQLQHQRVKVFVRRGGPNQEEGLLLMKQFLQENDLYGEVTGPEMVLTDIVTSAIRYLEQ